MPKKLPEIPFENKLKLRASCKTPQKKDFSVYQNTVSVV